MKKYSVSKKNLILKMTEFTHWHWRYPWKIGNSAEIPEIGQCYGLGWYQLQWQNSTQFCWKRCQSKGALLYQWSFRAYVKAQRQYVHTVIIFQQDSTPAHIAWVIQAWLRSNCSDFISSQEWLPSHPNLNPLDFCVRGMLESIVNAKLRCSIDSLKWKLIQEWEKLDMKNVRASIFCCLDNYLCPLFFLTTSLNNFFCKCQHMWLQNYKISVVYVE